MIYFKRNFFDFHKTLKRLNVSRSITNFNINLKYLLTHSTYKEIVDNSDSELLKFRSVYYQKFYEDPGKIQEVLKKHQENIEWNITRLYRIRNEIVHNAAIKSGIYTNIAHLKYYLSFILNSILDFMANGSVDIDNDGKITIDDYFITQEIILGSLKGRKLESFLEIENPNEIFQ
ncbi:hypothetical protein VS868_04400 [Salinimicrobium sp. 3283s]|uniref:hypothetical protein n=1 Tax=Salinimicrobium sp. 3283s TaxID=3114359 RepID=UPI0031E89E83